MTQSRKYIPEGLPAVIPQLIVKDARALMDFAARAFGAFQNLDDNKTPLLNFATVSPLQPWNAPRMKTSEP